MDRTKRELREEKREIKRRGNKHRRHSLKRGLREHPEEAHRDEPTFGRHQSSRLNGIDRLAAPPADPGESPRPA